MKGHMEDGKFHPHTEHKGVRKSRDQTAKTEGIPVERKARDNNAEILRNRIASFNRQFPVKPIEYGDAGGKSKGLKFDGTHSFIAGVMTRDEAIKTLEFFTTYFNALQTQQMDRKKRDEGSPITSVKSFMDAQKLGIETDGTVGTIVMGSGENYKIIGYKQGQTFSQDSISHISEFIKEYNIRVLSDSDSDFGKIFASTDKVAKMIAEDMLKPHTEFELTRIETKFVEVK